MIHEGVTIPFDCIAAAVRARMVWGCWRHRCAAGHVADAAGVWRGVAERWVGFPDCGALPREALAKARHPWAIIRKAVGLQDKGFPLSHQVEVQSVAHLRSSEASECRAPRVPVCQRVAGFMT